MNVELLRCVCVWGGVGGGGGGGGGRWREREVNVCRGRHSICLSNAVHCLMHALMDGWD